MEARSKILGGVIAGLVIVLAVLTIIIVRSSAQPEPPDLTPVEVTPETSAPVAPSESADPSEQPSEQPADDSSVPDELEHSYEPVPNPPREVPDDDDDDDDDGDDDDDDDDGDDDDDD